jgi:hypothetical protein
MTVMFVGGRADMGLRNKRFARRLGVTCQPRESPMATFSIFSAGSNSTDSW